ncbi:MAG TPA: hypothetical protein VMU50_23690 [Polyangia bacterium]|nr:hypothetical protein [Polyangia bacterium]
MDPGVALLVVALTAAAAADGGAGAPGWVPVASGRTTAVIAGAPLGQAVERAVPGRAFAQAVAQDAVLRWTEAATLYQQAILEWSAESRAHPSPALDRAVQKAERERQRSVTLANLELPRPPQPDAVSRAMAVERARLLRTKLMVVRANIGAVPEPLYARTRAALAEAMRGTDGPPATNPTEAQLLLCAAHAAADAPQAARLALARVPTEQRQDPANALAMAVCAAALGDQASALSYLETHLHQRIDSFTQRELYLANDWDRLRGQPRFEALFAGVAPPRY